ncbi:MAG: Zn-ribbon domain-containing OB-fold protein [Acidimicrobiia bacterium]
MSATPAKPLPVPDERSRGYWEAAARHELAIAKCTHCGRLSMPPGIVCVGCLNPVPSFEFTPVSGKGTVRSWVIMRDTFLPGFRDDIPYLLVDIEIDEQKELRLIGRLVDGPDANIHLGDRVSTVFDDMAPGVSVPAFKLEVTS